MNELIKHADFDVEILFKIYSEVVRRYDIPDIEMIRDLYDDRVQDRLTMFHYDVKPYELGAQPSFLIHNLRTYPESLLKNLSNQIGMKVVLETEEIQDVFDYFYICYKNDFDEIFHLPTREVW